jgi:hypothetical protein
VNWIEKLLMSTQKEGIKYCAELYMSPVGRQKMRLAPLGWLFLPPMLIDQWFIRRTHLSDDTYAATIRCSGGIALPFQSPRLVAAVPELGSLGGRAVGESSL